MLAEIKKAGIVEMIVDETSVVPKYDENTKTIECVDEYNIVITSLNEEFHNDLINYIKDYAADVLRRTENLN